MRLQIFHPSGTLRLVFVACLLGASSYLLFRIGTARYVVRANSQVTPFVFTAQTYLYSTNAAGDLNSALTEARRSDGTMVEIRSVGPLARQVSERKLRYPDGGRVTLMDLLRAKSSRPPQSDKATALWRARLFDPPANCVGIMPSSALVSQNELIFGQKIDVVRLNAIGGVRITAWRVPDLGCLNMRYRVEQQQPDRSYKLMSEQRPASLRVGEPDPGLFASGQGYEELRPSEMASKVRDLLGWPSSAAAEQMEARYDQMYESGLAAHPDWVGAH